MMVEKEARKIMNLYKGRPMKKSKHDYKVIRVNSFEEVAVYSKFTDWCISRLINLSLTNIWRMAGIIFTRQSVMIWRSFKASLLIQRQTMTSEYSLLAIIMSPDDCMAVTTRWNSLSGDNFLSKGNVVLNKL